MYIILNVFFYLKGLSNKKWDKTIKELAKNKLAAIIKTDKGLIVKVVNSECHSHESECHSHESECHSHESECHSYVSRKKRVTKPFPNALPPFFCW